MPGLDPGIHALAAKEDVDGRVKPGHDGNFDNSASHFRKAAQQIAAQALQQPVEDQPI